MRVTEANAISPTADSRFGRFDPDLRLRGEGEGAERIVTIVAECGPET